MYFFKVTLTWVRLGYLRLSSGKLWSSTMCLYKIDSFDVHVFEVGNADRKWVMNLPVENVKLVVCHSVDLLLEHWNRYEVTRCVE